LVVGGSWLVVAQSPKPGQPAACPWATASVHACSGSFWPWCFAARSRRAAPSSSPAGAAERSRAFSRSERGGAVRDGTGQYLWTARHGLARRSVLRGARVVRAAAPRCRRRVPVVERRIVCGGALAAFLIGFGTSGETDVAPYLLSRYFGLRSFSTLYGLSWMSHAAAGAVGPIVMGRAFDATGSYDVVLVRLSMLAVGVAALMLLMPRYDTARDGSVAVTV